MVLAPTRGFSPYGYYGVGETQGPPRTTAEKLAPGPAATKAAATTPPPGRSGGNSGNLTVPGYTPSTPTGAPYSPSEPGHSAADFAAAFAAKERREARRRLERQLGTLQPLAPPGTTSATNQFAQVIGGALGNPLASAASTISPLDSLLHQAQRSPQALLQKVPDLGTELRSPEPTDVVPQATISSMLRSSEQAPLRSSEQAPRQLSPDFKRELDTYLHHTIVDGKRPTRAEAEEHAAIYTYLLNHKELGRDPNGAGKLAYEVAAGKQPMSAIPAIGALLHRERTGGGQPVDFANTADPLGAKTLGNISTAQLAAAAKAGDLRISRKGILSTPENRHVLQRLLAAKQAFDASRPFGSVKSTGTLTPEEIGTLLVQESRHLHAGLNPAEVAEGIGVAEAESAGDSQEQRQLADFSDPEDAHIGLFAEEGNGFNLTPEQRLDPRLATRAAIERFVADDRSWNPAWVHWQEIQGENETGADRAPQYRQLATELLQQGRQVDPEAVKNLVDAKHAARAHGINPTPWSGDVEGGDQHYVYIRADAKGAVNWARSTLGTQEGSPRQRHWAELESLGPSEPWCADWVAVNLARRGVELPAGPNGSWSYADPDWKGGTQLGTDLAKAKPGDLIVYGEGSHIAMYVGDGKVIAGNYGDEVAEYGATEDARGITAIVRPHYKGGRVKVKAGSLPGSSVEGTFGGGIGGESTGGVVQGETIPAAAGGAAAQQAATAEAALAGFGPLAAPGFAAGVTQPEFGGKGSAEELLELLTQASTRVRA